MRNLGHANRLLWVSALHDQRRPLPGFLLLLWLADFHALEQWVVLHCFVALLDELNLVLTNTQGDVVRLVDPGVGCRQQALSREVFPILPAAQKLLAHMLDFVGGDGLEGAILVLNFLGVIRLHESCVARTCVVEAVRALFPRRPEALEHHHLPIWLQLLEHQADCCTHNAGPDENHVHLALLRLRTAEAEAAGEATRRWALGLGHPHGAALEPAIQLVEAVLGACLEAIFRRHDGGSSLQGPGRKDRDRSGL
mmetsp:Transcript_34780/g.64713  ORF Transcript_34780/g.64713 Transcript_34780/m.64713 type:complete len:253 (+) Transcript_34780:1100-1858(+)